MKTLLPTLRAAVVSTVLLAVLCCGFYPLAVTAISQAVFADKANGSLIRSQDGKLIGSSLIGQNFTGDAYFNSRPSAAGANGYDAASSSGSNLGPTSQKLADQIRERVAAYRAMNGLGANDAVPADAVTASGSGLDPHISIRNATIQARRIARVRSIPLEKITTLVSANTDFSNLGFLGESGVNVLKLNLALDSLK